MKKMCYEKKHASQNAGKMQKMCLIFHFKIIKFCFFSINRHLQVVKSGSVSSFEHKNLSIIVKIEKK